MCFYDMWVSSWCPWMRNFGHTWHGLTWRPFWDVPDRCLLLESGNVGYVWFEPFTSTNWFVIDVVRRPSRCRDTSPTSMFTSLLGKLQGHVFKGSRWSKTSCWINDKIESKIKDENFMGGLIQTNTKLSRIDISMNEIVIMNVLYSGLRKQK